MSQITNSPSPPKKTFWNYPSLTSFTSLPTTTTLSEQSNKDSSNKTVVDYSNSTDNEKFSLDVSQSDYFQYNYQNLDESPLSPVLFILDFDQTLCVYDEYHYTTRNVTDQLPSVYTRPFLYSFLNYIKKINTNNVVILWTAGVKRYIYRMLLLLDMTQYFEHILHRDHCDASRSRYKLRKSYKYLISLFPKYKHMRSILIDDQGSRNGLNSGYSRIINLKPYKIRHVVRTFGAFNVRPEHITDVKEFLRYRGQRGVSVHHNSSSSRRNNSKRSNYGDTALLSCLEYLRNNVFCINIDQSKKKRQLPPFHNCKYEIFVIRQQQHDSKYLEIQKMSGEQLSLAYNIELNKEDIFYSYINTSPNNNNNNIIPIMYNLQYKKI